MKWWGFPRKRPKAQKPALGDVLQRSLEALDCNFALFDPDRVLIFHNSSYAAQHSHSWDLLPRPIRYDDLMRAAICNSAPGGDVEAELARRIAAHETGGVQHFERLYPGDRWMSVSRCRLPDGYVAGLSLDIGALKAREAAAAATAARYRALVDTASVGIWHLDEAGRTLFANDQLAKLFCGGVPATIGEAGIEGAAPGETSPFGFPAGIESRASIPARPGRVARAVLVAASSWVPHTNGQRAAVLTLIDVTALDAARARAEHLAWHDVLTGLPNRAAFDRLLEGAFQSVSDVVALLLLDLDEFKAINDRHGHAAGDTVLREVAIRIRAALRPSDFACRLGGDEFAIVLRGVDSVGHTAETGSRLLRALRRPVVSDGLEIPLSASIGTARFPTDASAAETLQRAADLALYRVKHDGRGGMAAYSAEFSQALERRAVLRQALAAALAKNELALHWQSQHFTIGGAIRGAEALLRWPDSPLGDQVSPAEFLPLATEAGMMPAIDAWVLDTAVRQASHWSAQPGAPPLVSINISATSLRDPSFPPRVAAALMQYRLPASVLEIEIPEGITASEIDPLEEVLNGLRAIGVRLALDDVGAGLSTIAHLVRLPFDIIKLDRSIVAGLPGGTRDLAMLRAIAAIVQSLSIPLLAQGVETEAQVLAVRQHGCEIMQGFFFSRPVPAAALVPSIRSAARA